MECFVHEHLGPDMRAKQVSEEPLDGGYKSLGICQVVQPVCRENVGAGAEMQEGTEQKGVMEV